MAEYNDLWTEPRTWITGEIVTSSEMNTDVRDNMLAGNRLYHRDVATVEAVGTVAKTLLYSATILGGDMQDDRKIEFEVFGDYQIDTLGRSVDLSVEFGGAVLVADTWQAPGGSVGGSRKGWALTGAMVNRDNAADQYTRAALLSVSASESATNGEGGFGSSSGGLITGEDNVDTTVDQVFAVYVTPSNAAVSWKKVHAELRLV